MKTNRKQTEIPAALKHINVQALLRKRGIYLKQKTNKQLKETFLPVAEKIVKAKMKKVADENKKSYVNANKSYQPPAHVSISADEIMEYYYKQIHSVEVVEEHFDRTILKFLLFVRNKIIDNLEAEIEAKKSLKKWNSKDVFDDNEDIFLTEASLDFTPLLDNLAVIAGQDAYKLININDPYLASRDLRNKIASNVTKFTKSMLDTDRQHIIDIIVSGIDQGNSVVEIRNALTNDDALSFSKMQSQRITRTEVLRTSNQSALDAWQQSGVVEGKQWITAGASDECADYEGQVESLDGNFYSDTTEFADGDPPLHPNCRCTLIPIVLGGEKNLHPSQAIMKQRIVELEQQIDKRTKAFKDIQDLRDKDKDYIKALEDIAGIEHE